MTTEDPWRASKALIDELPVDLLHRVISGAENLLSMRAMDRRSSLAEMALSLATGECRARSDDVWNCRADAISLVGYGVKYRTGMFGWLCVDEEK